MTVAGRDVKEFQDVKALVSQLLLDHAHKIHLRFNYSLAREQFEDALPGEQERWERESDWSSGEHPTLSRLHAHCADMQRQGRRALVYYLHSKGSCCWKDVRQVYTDQLSFSFSQRERERNAQTKTKHFSPVATWRDLMNAATVEFPSICVRALLDKHYAACGAENQLAHYSGNFWWADCAHIAQLDPLPHRFDWRKPEFFVLFAHKKLDVRDRFGARCGYSVFNCAQNLYRHECVRARYRPKLWQDVWNDTIGASTARGRYAQPSEEFLPICKALRDKNRTLSDLSDELQQHFGH